MVPAQKVAYCKESVGVHTIFATYLICGSVTESKSYVKSAYGREQKCIVAYKLSHVVGWKIACLFVYHICLFWIAWSLMQNYKM